MNTVGSRGKASPWSQDQGRISPEATYFKLWGPNSLLVVNCHGFTSLWNRLKCYMMINDWIGGVDGVFESSNGGVGRIVEVWNGRVGGVVDSLNAGMVELSNGGMVVLIKLSSRRIAQWWNGRVGEVTESSNR